MIFYETRQDVINREYIEKPRRHLFHCCTENIPSPPPHMCRKVRIPHAAAWLQFSLRVQACPFAVQVEPRVF